MQEHVIDSVSIIFIGTGILLVIVIGFVMSMVLNQRRYIVLQEKRLAEAMTAQKNMEALSQEILRVQEDERKRLSRELHDDVGQLLTAINVNIERMPKGTNGFPPEAAKRVEDIRQLVTQVFESIRTLSRELRPMMLDELGLVPALQWYTKTFAQRTGIEVLFESDGAIEDLDADAKVTLYRVIQESLSNVLKHAAAQHVVIDLLKVDGQIALRIQDDGKAFQVDAKEKLNSRGRGLGLLGMQERVKLINGTFAITSTEGRGTTIKVEVPCGKRTSGQVEASAGGV